LEDPKKMSDRDVVEPFEPIVGQGSNEGKELSVNNMEIQNEDNGQPLGHVAGQSGLAMPDSNLVGEPLSPDLNVSEDVDVSSNVSLPREGQATEPVGPELWPGGGSENLVATASEVGEKSLPDFAHQKESKVILEEGVRI
jgi:hypothetical protein